MSAHRSVPVIDALSAAMAKVNSLTLVARNLADVARNLADVAGLDADVLNPFEA